MTTSAPVTCPASPGDLVAGKYRVEHVIAQGGMGVVLAARHETLEQRVAIKFLLPAIASRPEFVTRFLREAKAAARIQSEHVGRVYDVGTHDDGSPFMVMEYLEGSDLGVEIEQRGPIPVADAASWAAQALDALVEAHALGIVHRDLKPSNLFLLRRADGSRRVKVLDFGISKVDSSGADFQGALTSTQTLLGSPAYMSPEQVRSAKNVDARTDIWSMGVILYEMLTGRMLFSGETLGEVFSRIREDEIPSVASLQPGVPSDLDRIVMRCLERKPERRFGSAAELKAALAPFAAGASTSSGAEAAPSRASPAERAAPTLAAAMSGVEPTIAAPSSRVGAGEIERADPAPADASSTLAPSGISHAQAASPRVRPWLVPLVGGAVVVIAAAGWFLLRGGTAERVAPSREPVAASASSAAEGPSAAPTVVVSAAAPSAAPPASASASAATSSSPAPSASAAPSPAVPGTERPRPRPGKPPPAAGPLDVLKSRQ